MAAAPKKATAKKTAAKPKAPAKKDPSLLDKAAKFALKPVVRKVNYVKNVGKEVGDVAKAWQRATEMGGRVGAGTDEAANRLRRKQTKEQGQLAGAIFMGARYDEKGKRITAAKPATKKAAAKKPTTKKKG